MNRRTRPRRAPNPHKKRPRRSGRAVQEHFMLCLWCAYVERRLRAAHPAGNQQGDQRQGAEAEAHAQRRAGVAGLGRGVRIAGAAGGAGTGIRDVADVEGVVLIHVAEGVGAVVAVVQDAVDVHAVDDVAAVGGEGDGQVVALVHVGGAAGADVAAVGGGGADGVFDIRRGGRGGIVVIVIVVVIRVGAVGPLRGEGDGGRAVVRAASRIILPAFKP